MISTLHFKYKWGAMYLAYIHNSSDMEVLNVM